MSTRKRRPEGPPSEILDRAHLARYTLDNRDLEREIVTLFLNQLPVALDALRKAKNQSEWKLAAHTLKGSAAAVGATRINALAIELEGLVFGIVGPGKAELLGKLAAAIEQFRKAALPVLG